MALALIQKPLFTFKFEGSLAAVFPGDFIRWASCGVHADSVSGAFREAFDKAKADYSAR